MRGSKVKQLGAVSVELLVGQSANVFCGQGEHRVGLPVSYDTDSLIGIQDMDSHIMAGAQPHHCPPYVTVPVANTELWRSSFGRRRRTVVHENRAAVFQPPER